MSFCVLEKSTSTEKKITCTTMQTTHDARAIRGLPDPRSPKSSENAFILKKENMAVLMATTHGSSAKRSLMIPLLATNLRQYEGDIYDAFLVTNDQIQRKSDQIAVFHSTLTKKLSLSKIFTRKSNKQTCKVM